MALDFEFEKIISDNIRLPGLLWWCVRKISRCTRKLRQMLFKLYSFQELKIICAYPVFQWSQWKPNMLWFFDPGFLGCWCFIPSFLFCSYLFNNRFFHSPIIWWLNWRNTRCRHYLLTECVSVRCIKRYILKTNLFFETYISTFMQLMLNRCKSNF